MRIKLDENLPSRLASRLGDLRHDVQTVAEEGIAGKDDAVIWETAEREARFLITPNTEFSIFLHFSYTRSCARRVLAKSRRRC